MKKSDVIIIGGGVIGCAVARELSAFDCKIAVLERGEDVACGASKANSGIVHAGFDAKAGTNKAKYNLLGNEMFDKIAKDLDVPFVRCGSLVICLEGEDEGALRKLLQNGQQNGVKGLQILSKEQCLELEPNLNPDVKCALYAPTGGVVGPYELTIAYAENAAANGVEFFFYKNVVNVQQQQGFLVSCEDGSQFFARAIVNAAGCNSDDISNMVCQTQHKIVARRGEYCLLDKNAGKAFSHTIFQLPSAMGKGVLVTPTAHGNLLVGPTAVDSEHKDVVDTTVDGLNEVLTKCQKTYPKINRREIITQFGGNRAHSITDDFVVQESSPHFFNALGIESPGLTSAPAIGVDLANMVAKKLSLAQNKNFEPKRQAIACFASMTEQQRKDIIAKNPAYGAVVCRCENVTEGEIVEAIRRVPHATTLDAVKRRTRAGMGRCQAGFCSPRILQILARELDVPLTSVTKCGTGAEILLFENKRGEQ